MGRGIAPKRTRKRGAPSRMKIVGYWLGEGTFDNLFEDEAGCFACGAEFSAIADVRKVSVEARWKACRLETAHLVPFASGGSNQVSNLVLLCVRCHREAPMIGTSAQPMVDWINRREGYVSYAWRRVWEECNAIDPGLLDKVARSMWAGQGETMDARTQDFIKKAEMMQKHLRIGLHPGGEIFSTIAAIIGAMGELAIPATPTTSARSSEQNEAQREVCTPVPDADPD